MSEAPSEEGADPKRIAGERGVAAVEATRTLQSRVSNMLAMGLMGALGLGLLGWYYAHAFKAQGEVKRAAQASSRNQAVGEMALPSLGKIDPPPAPIAKILGPAPEAPPLGSDPAPLTAVPAAPPVYGTPQPEKPPWKVALERRLGGAVSTGPDIRKDVSSAPAQAQVSSPAEESGAVAGESALGSLLHPTAIAAARARVLPAERLLLPKGAFIDCTLETAIDSTLPGMTTCVTATDTFGVDGSTVLIERGSKLVGETRGEVHQGAARVFVLWTEARTPTGVIVPLNSPGTDELGRSGLPGEDNRHFFERFGAAILISVIDGAVQSAVTSRGDGTTVTLNPSTSQDVMTEVLKSTVNIPPTITKAQGDRIQVLVARDLDFRSVYELKSTKP